MCPGSAPYMRQYYKAPIGDTCCVVVLQPSMTLVLEVMMAQG